MSLDQRASGNPEARPQEVTKIPLRPLASAPESGAATYTGWSPTAWRGQSQAGVEKR